MFDLLSDLYEKPAVPAGILLPQDDEADQSPNSSRVTGWLENRPPKLVIYVALGSEAPLTVQSIHELALGLELAGVPFLWALRKPAGTSDGELLPAGFEERTRGRGLVCTEWVPQVKVLAHGATGASSDDFADRHLRLANHPSCPKILLLQDSLCHGPKMHMWSPEHPSGAKLMDIPCHLARDNFPYNPSTFIRRRFTNLDYNVPRLITQQCRGLVILKATALEIHYLCNPSTGQMTALPEGRPTGCRGRMESTHKYASLGLGYDLCTRKHKIVRIYYGSHSADKFPISTGCEVYEVNSTGLWRPPKSGILEKPAGWVNKDERSVFAHGHIYWLAQRKLESPSEMFIISFSLHYEKFGILTTPLSTPDIIKENNTFVTHHLTQLVPLL
jgi:F-box interacting protein